MRSTECDSIVSMIRCSDAGTMMRRMASMLLLQHQLLVLMLVMDSADAVTCHQCSSLTNEACTAFDASGVSDTCEGENCISLFDAAAPDGLFQLLYRFFFPSNQCLAPSISPLIACLLD